MNRIRIICILLLWLCNASLGAGVWLKNPTDANRFSGLSFQPEFFILKLNAFSSNGSFRSRWTPKDLAQICSLKAPLFGWVTRRLSVKEVLTKESGKKLASNLNNEIKGSCISEIELDMEPMAAPPRWLNEFLRSVRTHLDSNYKLSLAIPALSASKIPGYSWTPEWAKEILAEIDSLDIMNYDTGLSSTQAYKDLIKTGLDFAKTIVTQFPEKRVLMGFPAYKDRTRHHQQKVENLNEVLNTLTGVSESKFFCNDRIRFAHYAGWTMDGSDVKYANLIENWKKTHCH